MNIQVISPLEFENRLRTIRETDPHFDQLSQNHDLPDIASLNFVQNDITYITSNFDDKRNFLKGMFS